MVAVNETIVREYFESLGFTVSRPCKYVVPGRKKSPEEEIDLVVCNPVRVQNAIPEAVIWDAGHLAAISRAIVGIRIWHSNRFYPADLHKATEVAGFTSAGVLKAGAKRLGTDQPARILCVSDLPASVALRRNTLEMIRKMGIDGVILFNTMLQHLIGEVDRHRNYEKSDLLQTLRVLKSHGFLSGGQLELFTRARRSRKQSQPPSPESSSSSSTAPA